MEGLGRIGGPEVVERCSKPLTQSWPAVPERLFQEGWGSGKGQVSARAVWLCGGVNHTGAGSLVWEGW